MDMAELLAGHLGLSYVTRADLGENDRSATGYLPREEFEATADLFFKHPDRSVRGWEPARAAQARIVGAIDDISKAAPHVNMAVVAHGGVGALLLCRLKGVPISRAEDQPGEGGRQLFRISAGRPLTTAGVAPNRRGANALRVVSARLLGSRCDRTSALPDKLHFLTVRRSTRFRAMRSRPLLAGAAAGQSNFVGRGSCWFGRGGRRKAPP
jgi:hypothetical protein